MRYLETWKELDDYLQAYELLRIHGGPAFARRLLVSHAVDHPPMVVTHKNNGKVIALAFCWRISDPYDVVEMSGFPGYDPNGNYIYWPFIYIASLLRGNGILGELLLDIKILYPGVKRIAFHRRGKLHIFDLEKVLCRLAGLETDNGSRRTRQTAIGIHAGSGGGEGQAAVSFGGEVGPDEASDPDRIEAAGPEEAGEEGQGRTSESGVVRSGTQPVFRGGDGEYLNRRPF